MFTVGKYYRFSNNWIMEYVGWLDPGVEVFRVKGDAELEVFNTNESPNILDGVEEVG